MAPKILTQILIINKTGS